MDTTNKNPDNIQKSTQASSKTELKRGGEHVNYVLVKQKGKLGRGKTDTVKLKTIGSHRECEERACPAEAGWKREGRVQLLNPDRRPL